MSAPDHDPAVAPAECPACLAAGPRRLTATEARALVEERQGGPITPEQGRALDLLHDPEARPAPCPSCAECGAFASFGHFSTCSRFVSPIDPAPDLAGVIASAPGVSGAMVMSDRKWMVLCYGGREVQVVIRDIGPWKEVQR